MFEITINGVAYQFNFGMGFLREVNHMYEKPIDNVPGKTEGIGLQIMVAGLYARDTEFLVMVLEAANKGQNPRITRVLLDHFIDNECADIDGLFAQVLDFLSAQNATKNVTNKMLEALREQEKKQQAQ